MRKIIATEFISADGVSESPEKWSLHYWNSETEKFKNEELENTGSLLLGRVTYEGFAQAWPRRTGAFADKFNSIPKCVASNTLRKVDWNGSQLLKGVLAEAVRKLKSKPGGDIYIHGSLSIVQELLRHGLVDRISLLSYPVALGTGKHLFAAGDHHKLDLISAQRFSNGVLALEYVPAKA